jgi:hypothetical protein
MNKPWLIPLALMASGASAAPECKQQAVQKSAIEMCLVRGTDFIHDVYMLKVDQALIFALADDFAQSVALEHTVPEGPALEFRCLGKPAKLSASPGDACRWSSRAAAAK